MFLVKQESKKIGFSDKQIASLVQSSETVIRTRRKRLGVPGPWVKQVEKTALIIPIASIEFKGGVFLQPSNKKISVDLPNSRYASL
jgi:hypothetical protein